jgi:hypothetical protein
VGGRAVSGRGNGDRVGDGGRVEDEDSSGEDAPSLPPTPATALSSSRTPEVRARCRHLDCALECYAAAAAAVPQQLHQPTLSTIILIAAMQFRLLNAVPYRPIL